MSLASTSWENAQVRVSRTFLEVVEMCAAPEARSRTMPALPSLGLDLEEEPAPGLAVLGEPSFKEKHHESDQDQKFVVRVSRTFLEVVPDVTEDAELASRQLRSSSMPVLPSCGLDFEKEGEEEESFGASESQEAPEPILRGTPIFHPHLAEPVVGITMCQAVEVMESQAMGLAPRWAEPLLNGLVVHPVDTDPGVQMQEEIDVERFTGEEEAVGNQDGREELKLVPQHADAHSGPFPLHMVERHNNGQCFPCVFFSARGDGCRKGDNCTHCHVCLPHEIRRRRNRISAEMKRAKKAASRHQHDGA
ncbi:ku80 [Symbiodinium sp. CCMP2592]|nr:ku80 [Symbiodinium sp. CCMP2592]